MSKQTTARGIATLAITLVVASGCASGGQTASTDSATPRAGGASQSPSSGDHAEAPAKDGKGVVATPRNTFVPLLQKAHDTYSWPGKYDTTGTRVYIRIAATAAETAYVAKDANSFMAFYNTCAWTLQLIHEAKTKADTKTSTSGLAKLSAASTPDTGLDKMIGPILAGARRSDLAPAESFVLANDCATGLG